MVLKLPLIVTLPRSASCKSTRATPAAPPRLLSPLRRSSLNHTSAQISSSFPLLLRRPNTIPFTNPRVGLPLILIRAFSVDGSPVGNSHTSVLGMPSKFRWIFASVNRLKSKSNMFSSRHTSEV